MGCSFHADHIEGALLHRVHHDVTLLADSRAPPAEIEAFKNRMGWRFKWVSSHGGDFSYDFHVSFTTEQIAQGRTYYNYEMRALKSEEMSGISVFFKDETGDIFNTYSSYARGGDISLGT